MESALIPVWYYGEFQMNENGRWSWKWTSDEDGVSEILLTSVTSYSDMHRDLQNLLNINPSQYDMNLRFLFGEHSSFPIPLMMIISEDEMKCLIHLNKDHPTPLYVTLVRKNIPESEHGESDARKDDVIISETVVTHHDFIVMHKPLEVVQDNEEELIAFSSQRHEQGESLRAGSSTLFSNSSRVVPDDEDLEVEELFDTKRDLQEVVHMIALKHNFEFKVKKSNKTTYTIVCVDSNCSWRLRATKMNTNESFIVRKYAREHTCQVGSCRNDHKQIRSWFIGRQLMHKFQDSRTIYRPVDIINDVRREYGVVMSYQKARKAKECALKDLNTAGMPSTREFPPPRKCSRCSVIGHTRQLCTS